MWSKPGLMDSVLGLSTTIYSMNYTNPGLAWFMSTNMFHPFYTQSNAVSLVRDDNLLKLRFPPVQKVKTVSGLWTTVLTSRYGIIILEFYKNILQFYVTPFIINPHASNGIRVHGYLTQQILLTDNARKVKLSLR